MMLFTFTSTFIVFHFLFELHFIPSNLHLHLHDTCFVDIKKTKNLQKFDSSYFKGKGHFEDGTQNYLVFQPMQKYFKRIAGVGSAIYIFFWKSKGLLDERINSNTDLITVLLQN